MSSTKCECGCCHVPDHGACDTFEPSADPKQCVYCDHSQPCHERDKDKPYFNMPLGVGQRKKVAS